MYAIRIIHVFVVKPGDRRETRFAASPRKRCRRELPRQFTERDGGAILIVSDNATVSRFARAVLAVEPTATGEAIGSIEWGATIVEAFIEAMVLALISIAILLWIVLRRVA